MPRIIIKPVLVVTMIVLWWAIVIQAGALEKRSRIELKFGFWNQGRTGRVVNRIGNLGLENSIENGGFSSAFSYGYWMQENLAFTLSINFLAVEVSSQVGTSGVMQRTVAVMPILMGFKYYFPASTYKTSFRPFITAALGPYFGFESRNEINNQSLQESHIETTFGGLLGGGVDIQLSRHFMLGTSLGYHVMRNFSESLGGRKNFNGLEFGLGISFLFGKGVQSR